MRAQSSYHRPPWRRLTRWLGAGALALAALGRAPAPAYASYAETSPTVYLGTGGAATAGGSVDVATGAALLPINFGKIDGVGHVPVRAGMLWKAQDASPGPFGPGTYMDLDWFLEYDYGSYNILVGPGNRRFYFGDQDANGNWIDTRDPEMLGATLHVIRPPVYGQRNFIVWKDGTKWYFDGYGTQGLQSIYDPHGNTVIYWIYRGGTGFAGKVLLNSGTAYQYRYIQYNTSLVNGVSQVTSVNVNYDAGGAGSPNRTWTLGYDGNGRLQTITDAMNDSTSLAWTTYTRGDGQVLPLLTTLTNPRGNAVVTNQYDGSGRVTRQTYADNGYRAFSYSAAIGANGSTTVTDQNNNSSTWAYTWLASGDGAEEGYHLDRFTDPLGRQTQWAAQQPGVLLDTQITDYRNRVTNLAWDFAKGNLTGVSWTTPANQTASWSYTFDPTFSRVTSVTDPLGNVTTYTINASNGDVTAIKDARGYTTSFTRDNLGNVTGVTNALNQASSFTYDSLGMGELTSATDALNHQTVFGLDSAGRTTSIQDANGKTAQIAYNLRDQVTSITQYLNGSPLTTSFGFDADGNRTSLTDAKNQVWSWTFDSRDRVSQALNPPGQAIGQTFDGNSNLLTRTDRDGNQAVYTYGAGDMLSQVTYYLPGHVLDSQINLTYDPTTHLLTGCNDTAPGAGNCTFQYDSLDRLTVAQTPNGTLTYTLDDKVNRRDALQVSGQSAISYGYDANQNMTGITQGSATTTVCYDPLGRICQQTLANGVTTNWSFDAAGFLTSLVSSKGSTTLDSHSYTRDNVGNPTQEVIGGLVNSTSTFGYDDLYRPTSATDATGVYSWGYDADNNRLSQTLNGQPTAYTVDTANRLTSVGGTPVTTDANGNILVDANGNSYHWDARGRLTSVTHNGTTLASFTYASNGIRTSATEGGVTTNFTLDGTLCVAENIGSGPLQSMFGPTGVLCRGAQWFTPTAQGSIGSVTDGLGNAVAQNRYGVFGQVVTTNPNSGNPLQFLGGMSDATTGLDYMGRSFYSPGLGLNVSGGGSFTDQSFGSAAGEFAGGVGNCLKSTVKTLISAAEPLGGLERFLKGLRDFANEVETHGLWAATLEPTTSALQQFGDWTSPRAAGNTTCHLSLLALALSGTVPESGGGDLPPVDVPPVEPSPAWTPPTSSGPLFRAVSDAEAAAIQQAGGAVPTTGGSIAGATRVFTANGWSTLKPFLDAENAGAPGTYTQVVTFNLNSPVSLLPESPLSTYVVDVGELNGSLGSFGFTPLDQFSP